MPNQLDLTEKLVPAQIISREQVAPSDYHLEVLFILIQLIVFKLLI